jgi:hypothetical protein
VQSPIADTDLKAVWGPTQRLVFGGSVAAALVVAALIVYV